MEGPEGVKFKSSVRFVVCEGIKILHYGRVDSKDFSAWEMYFSHYSAVLRHSRIM